MSKPYIADDFNSIYTRLKQLEDEKVGVVTPAVDPAIEELLAFADTLQVGDIIDYGNNKGVTQTNIRLEEEIWVEQLKAAIRREEITYVRRR